MSGPILAAMYPERSYYGGPDYQCNHCGALFWYQESLARVRIGLRGLHTICVAVVGRSPYLCIGLSLLSYNH